MRLEKRPVAEGDGTRRFRLTRIRAYPLKGAAGYDLSETLLDELGIPLDRRWMLVDEGGNFISQRTHPRLALIQVREVEGGVSVTAPGMSPMSLVLPPGSGPRREVRVHRDRFEALQIPGDPALWFSEYLGHTVEVAFMPDEIRRPVDPEYAPGYRVSFADGFPLHLASEGSLDDLNRRMTTPVKMIRFRPNLVVSGSPAWEEDTWREVEIGGTRLRIVKPCARCQVPLVDPATGLRGREPLRTLGRFRTYMGKTYFGQNAVFPKPGGLRVGDEVKIIEKGDARPPL